MKGWIKYTIMGFIAFCIIAVSYNQKKEKEKEIQAKEYNEKSLAIEKVCIDNNIAPCRYDTEIKPGKFYGVSTYLLDGFYSKGSLQLHSIDTSFVVPDNFPVEAYNNGDIIAVFVSGEITRKLEYSIGSTETYKKIFNLQYSCYYDMKEKRFIYNR